VVVSQVVPLDLEVELSDDDLEQVTGGLARIPHIDEAF
jgi:bacteriocin-like protein